MIWLLLLLACKEPTPQDFAGCAAVKDPIARQNCWFDFARALQDPKELDKAVGTVQDPLERDLLIDRLIVTQPTLGPRLCAQVTTPSGQEKCRQVLGRPHLGAPRKKEK